MGLLEYVLLAASSLFVIIDPIGLIPVFLAITPHDSAAQRSRMAGLACLVAACVLIFFMVTGQSLFRFLGITMAPGALS